MTLKTVSHSNRLVYVILLFVFGVVLATALALAGERSSESLQKSTPLIDGARILPAQPVRGLPHA